LKLPIHVACLKTIRAFLIPIAVRVPIAIANPTPIPIPIAIPIPTGFLVAAVRVVTLRRAVAEKSRPLLNYSRLHPWI
jgi:hypothetical protein